MPVSRKPPTAQAPHSPAAPAVGLQKELTEDPLRSNSRSSPGEPAIAITSTGSPTLAEVFACVTGSFGSVTAVTEPVAFPASVDVSWKVIVLMGAAASEQVGQAVKSGTPTVPWPETSIMRPAVSCRPQVPTKAVNEGAVVVGGAVVVLTPWTCGLPGCNGRTGDFGADDGVVEQPATRQARARARPGRIDRAHLSVTSQERTALDPVQCSGNRTCGGRSLEPWCSCRGAAASLGVHEPDVAHYRLGGCFIVSRNCEESPPSDAVPHRHRSHRRRCKPVNRGGDAQCS